MGFPAPRRLPAFTFLSNRSHATLGCQCSNRRDTRCIPGVAPLGTCVLAGFCEHNSILCRDGLGSGVFFLLSFCLVLFAEPLPRIVCVGSPRVTWLRWTPYNVLDAADCLWLRQLVLVRQHSSK